MQEARFREIIKERKCKRDFPEKESTHNKIIFSIDKRPRLSLNNIHLQHDCFFAKKTMERRKDSHIVESLYATQDEMSNIAGLLSQVYVVEASK